MERIRDRGQVGMSKMKRKNYDKAVRLAAWAVIALLLTAILFCLWREVPKASVRYTVLGLAGGVALTAAIWSIYVQRRTSAFADELIETLDCLMNDRQPENYSPYEDTLNNKVEGKLLQFYDIMNQEREQSRQDKKLLQEIVSDISHQVKTPIANVKMFTGILKQHELPEEKRREFLGMMEGQINKLDFLMQSLIKMSRLETGTFTLHSEEACLYDTIAQAVGGIWTKAEKKDIQIDVECESTITVKHDPKWTAEALMNILDNGVKYTPSGGLVSVRVQPWQFYTRIDISDTGIGIKEENYHDVFKRFYRGGEAAGQEGVGLGLYLAQGIITRQKGYITVKSQPGRGSVFSVYLLS